MEHDKMTKYELEIDDELDRKLKEIANFRGLSVTEVIILALKKEHAPSEGQDNGYKRH